MIAGASWSWWVGFHLVAAALVLADTLGLGKRRSAATAWLATGVLVAAAAGFAAWIAVAQGRQPALEFVGGYAMETSLSVDNLFVFLVIFRGFSVGPERQHKALLWGVAGAVVLRAVFVASGITLIRHFDWIPQLFGVFLLTAAWRMLRGGSASMALPKWLTRMQAGTGSLLPVILAIELSDVLFATDSIPAVLGISRNPFIVYTSNIAAVLALRSLYTALSGLLGRLRYLHYGLAALLGFVALKMLADPWIEVPITTSLAVMGGILAVCAAVEMMGTKGLGTRD
jgi:tellurite resistance protein TerC